MATTNTGGSSSGFTQTNPNQSFAPKNPQPNVSKKTPDKGFVQDNSQQSTQPVNNNPKAGSRGSSSSNKNNGVTDAPTTGFVEANPNQSTQAPVSVQRAATPINNNILNGRNAGPQKSFVDLAQSPSRMEQEPLDSNTPIASSAQGGTISYGEATTPRATGFELAVQDFAKVEEEFRNSPQQVKMRERTENTRNFANFVTGGGTMPVEQRSGFAQFGTGVVEGGLLAVNPFAVYDFGVTLGRQAVLSGQKAVLVGQGLVAQRDETLAELGRAGRVTGTALKSPETLGMIAGGLITGKLADFTLARVEPRVTFQSNTINVPTTKMGTVREPFTTLNRQGEATTFIGETTGEVQSTFTARTLAIGKGDKQVAILTTTQGEGATGLAISPFQNPTRVRAGGLKYTSEQIQLSELTGNVEQPLTALGGRNLQKVVKLSPQEQQRINLGVQSATQYGGVAGLPVKNPLFNVEGISNKGLFTSEVETFGVSTKGPLRIKGGTTYFGTAPSRQQMGAGAQTLMSGDLDASISGRASSSLPKIEKLAKNLRSGGEDIMVNPDQPNVLQTRSGQKRAEFKFPDDKSFDSGGEVAPEGFLSIFYSGKKVPFGRNTALTLGEQLQRKTGASLTLSSGRAKGETASFSEAGVLGKQGYGINAQAAGRGLKDVAGQQIILRNIPEQFVPKGAKTPTTYADEILSTYSKSQQKDILGKVDKLLNRGELQSLSGKSKSRLSPSQRIQLIDQVQSPLVSAQQRSGSPIISPSPLSLTSPSSPKPRSPSPFSKSPSPYDGSPPVSPRSPSPYTYKSPKSPSPPISPSPSSYFNYNKQYPSFTKTIGPLEFGGGGFGFNEVKTGKGPKKRPTSSLFQQTFNVSNKDIAKQLQGMSEQSGISLRGF